MARRQPPAADDVAMLLRGEPVPWEAEGVLPDGVREWRFHRCRVSGVVQVVKRLLRESRTTEGLFTAFTSTHALVPMKTL